jgi:HNH endonuclease
VFSALIGWLLLATVIGVNDPSGSLWWLQIIIFITAVIAVIKLPIKQANQQSSIQNQNYPASYANMQQSVYLLDTLSSKFTDFLSFLVQEGSLAGDDLRMVVAAYAKVLYYDHFFTTVPYGDVYNNIFVVISRYLALGRIPDYRAAQIIMESRKRIDELLVLERRVAFEVPAAFAAEFHNRWKARLEMEAQREAEIDRVAQNPRYIPQQVKLEVFHRDKGRCVKCGSSQQIEFDHIIPVSLGGSSTANNVQLLCQSCNRTKGNREVG